LTQIDAAANEITAGVVAHHIAERSGSEAEIESG
jgi:hypothetical protein